MHAGSCPRWPACVTIEVLSFLSDDFIRFGCVDQYASLSLKFIGAQKQTADRSQPASPAMAAADTGIFPNVFWDSTDHRYRNRPDRPP